MFTEGDKTEIKDAIFEFSSQQRINNLNGLYPNINAYRACDSLVLFRKASQFHQVCNKAEFEFKFPLRTDELSNRLIEFQSALCEPYGFLQYNYQIPKNWTLLPTDPTLLFYEKYLYPSRGPKSIPHRGQRINHRFGIVSLKGVSLPDALLVIDQPKKDGGIKLKPIEFTSAGKGYNLNTKVSGRQSDYNHTRWIFDSNEWILIGPKDSPLEKQSLKYGNISYIPLSTRRKEFADFTHATYKKYALTHLGLTLEAIQKQALESLLKH